MISTAFGLSVSPKLKVLIRMQKKFRSMSSGRSLQLADPTSSTPATFCAIGTTSATGLKGYSVKMPPFLKGGVRQLMGSIFVPLSANNETHLIELLKREQIDRSFGHLPEYRLLRHALEYETAMELQGNAAQMAFSTIYRGLTGLADHQFIHYWPLVLKYNFMGLALRKTAGLCASNTEKAELRDRARQHYQDGISMLESVVDEHQPSSLCVDIWRVVPTS